MGSILEYAAESCAHLFFACPFSLAIWNHIRTWLGIQRQMSTLESAIKWIKKNRRARACVLLALHVWCTRFGGLGMPQLLIKNPHLRRPLLLGSN
ncbi:hypothetical protein Leryth_021617 [Lithospermum erythrorhizon]|nr:hypothetical protein Leryth_021617 [Lithospermum erythrorhizon]